MHILCSNQKNIILSLFKIDTLNFTMHILTIMTSPSKTYVILTKRSLFFFIIVKRETKTNKLLKQKNNQKQPFADVFENRCS